MTVADEIIEQAIEQNAAAVTPDAEAPSAPVVAKSPPAGFVDPLDESLFSDEALKDPKVVQERAQLLREQVKEALKIRQAAHNARAEAQAKEARFKKTKEEVLAEKAAQRNWNNMTSAMREDMLSGDPARFIKAIARLSGKSEDDAHEFWRGELAPALATGKPIKKELPPEVLELRREIEAMKAQKEAEVAQQTEAQIDQQIYQARVAQLEQAKSYIDLPYVSSLAAEQPALVDARIVDIRQQHYQQTGQPLDLRAACDMVETEIRSHYELLQRTGGASGQPNGNRGAAAPAAGQAGNPERFAKPVTAPSAPAQQRTLPTSLTTEPGATNRHLSESELRQAQIEAFEKMGLFANFGM